MDIKEIQRIVGVTPDGINGPKTQAAIKAYQSSHGLTPDGIVGSKTLAVMQGQNMSVAPKSNVNMSVAPSNSSNYSSTSSSNNNATKTTLPVSNTSSSSGNLAIGSKGPAVIKLQQMLGLTPDGIFGPKTQAAVIAYQQQNGLKADGIVGPLTNAKLNASNNTQTQNNINTKDQTQMNPQLGMLGAIADVATNTYSTKNSGLTLDEALKAAQNDHNIVEKYSDMMKLDKQAFSQQIGQLQQQISTDSQQQQTKFENERRQLSENFANAGQAYSGLRQRAQQQLGEQQSGIIQSSKSTIQKQLNDMTAAFEGKYGSGSASPYTAQFKDPFASSNVSLSGLKQSPTSSTSNLSGQMAGGITGTAPLAQKQDVLNKGADLYYMGQLPKM
jgi:peptidoglycan hydrolase-like protein with peptidoglycan-binding domain